MNSLNYTNSNFVNSLIATYKTCTDPQGSRTLPEETEPRAHDSVEWLPGRQIHSAEARSNEAKRRITPDNAVLVLDDSTLDKPGSHQLDQVTWHWSRKHQQFVQGVNLISVLWTDGSAIVPVDSRIWCPEKDGMNRNDHFRDMLVAVKVRQFLPHCILFDAGYSGIDNLKLVRSLEWHWCTLIKPNRLVNPDHTTNRKISEIDVPPEGSVVHLRQYGFIRLFRVVPPKGEVEYWATDILDTAEPDR